jgi:RimJ/RimL family protein N-acetyltransferase
LRPFTTLDLDVVAAMVEDEEQMRFYPRPRTRDEASAWIDRNLRLYEEHGYGIWFIESIATSEFLGYCGVRPITLMESTKPRSGGTRGRSSGVRDSQPRPPVDVETWLSVGWERNA